MPVRCGNEFSESGRRLNVRHVGEAERGGDHSRSRNMCWVALRIATMNFVFHFCDQISQHVLDHGMRPIADRIAHPHRMTCGSDHLRAAHQPHTRVGRAHVNVHGAKIFGGWLQSRFTIPHRFSRLSANGNRVVIAMTGACNMRLAMNRRTSAPLYIHIHASDNVAIVVDAEGLKAGTGLPDGLKLREHVPQAYIPAGSSMKLWIAMAAPCLLRDGSSLKIRRIWLKCLQRGCGGTKNVSVSEWALLAFSIIGITFGR